jgi:RNase P/RNase MRP subunit p29
VSGSDLADDVAVVVVEAVELVDELIGLAVRVVVSKNTLGVGNHVGSVVELESDRVNSTRVAGGSRANDLDVRVSLGDGIVERLEAELLVRVPAIGVTGQPILVTDLDVVEFVRLRVTKLSTACTPLRVGWAFDELDLVEAVVDERLKLLRSSKVAVERKTGVATNDCDVC